MAKQIKTMYSLNIVANDLLKLQLIIKSSSNTQFAIMLIIMRVNNLSQGNNIPFQIHQSGDLNVLCNTNT